jgi:hypothetical protein
MNHADKSAELDRLLNDPEVALDPARIWQLLAEISGRPAGSPVEQTRQATGSPAQRI